MRISVVVPLFRVERYLPDLLRSFELQRAGAYELEYLFVDDGSPDRSGDMAQEWLRTQHAKGRVIRQANSGVGAARNAGIDAASGDWVTFPDSDDRLDPAYFASIASFIVRAREEPSVVAARLIMQYDPDPRLYDVHPLAFRFALGNRVVRMHENPDVFQLNVASAFFRRQKLLEARTRFRTTLHASEDALFVAGFLLHQSTPTLGLVADARYIYRKREARDSAVDRYRFVPETYWERFEDGYLPLMERAAVGGEVPEWLQAMFLYETQWLLPAQLDPNRRADQLDEVGTHRALSAIARCATFVSADRLFAYDATALPMESRLLLQALTSRPLPHWAVVNVRRTRGHWELSAYLHDHEKVHVHGLEDDPQLPDSAEWSTPEYFGQSVIHRWHTTSNTKPTGIAIGGTTFPVHPSPRGETEAEQRDIRRRRTMNARLLAVPSREDQIPVWKMLPWRGDNLGHRITWNWRILIRWARHTVRRVIRICRGDA